MSTHEVDWAPLWSESAKTLSSPSAVAVVMKFWGMPGLIGMHGGLPPYASFPFKAMDLHFPETIPSPAAGEPVPAATNEGPFSTLSVTDPKLMMFSQQYVLGPRGHPSLVNWCIKKTQELIKPIREVGVVMTAGSVNSLFILTSLLCNRGDYVICEEFSYNHAVESVFGMLGAKPIGVAMDNNGMVPEALEQALAAAPEKPKFLYLIPSGQNPTGINYSLERISEIYAIAQKHSIVIVEDDAYFWLRYTKTPKAGPSSLPHVPEGAMPGITGLSPTFLSIDTDGRVIRLDTFAKLLGPGHRLGWVSGHPTLIKNVEVALASMTCCPNSFSSVAVDELMKVWGDVGLDQFVQRVQTLCAGKIALAAKTMTEHMSGLIEFEKPEAGMFMWAKLTGKKADGSELEFNDYMPDMEKYKVVVLPGKLFRVGVPASVPCPYFRASVAGASDHDITEGFKRLGEALRAAGC